MKSRLIFPQCKNFFPEFFVSKPLPPHPHLPSPHFRVPEAFAVLSYFMLIKSIIRGNVYLLPCVAGAGKRWVRQKTGRTGNTPGIRELLLPSRVSLQDPRFFLRSFYLQAPATYDVYKEPKGANEPLSSQESAYFSSKDSRIYVKTRNCIKWMYLQPTFPSDHFCLRCRSVCTSYPWKILFFWIPRKSSLSILVINAP